VTVLALPPPAFSLVPDGWNGGPQVAPVVTRIDRVDDGQRAWQNVSPGAVPEVDVSIWADGARALTAAALYSAELHPLTFADITVTAIPAVKASLDLATKTTHCNTVIEAPVAGEGGNALTIAFVQSAGAPNVGALTKSGVAYTFTFKNGVTTVANFEAAVTASADLDVKTPGTGANLLATTVDEFTATALAGGDDSELNSTAHGLLTGDTQVQVTTTGTMPAGLVALTDYYAVKDDADNVGLAATLSDALAGNLIQFTSAGTGTIKIVATANTQRVHWQAYKQLGLAGDGAITLDGQQAYRVTVPHRARCVGYTLTATFGAGAGKVSAAVYPVVDAS
jgi:hypothetical protein